MPRDIDVVGVWHGTPYQVASVSSTADGVIVACGPAGTHKTYPKTGHRRHTKDPSSGTSTWHERHVLSDVTLAQPLQDRKSTRLNSSHGYISYAVFCLKKKKKQEATLLGPIYGSKCHRCHSWPIIDAALHENSDTIPSHAHTYGGSAHLDRMLITLST